MTARTSTKKRTPKKSAAKKAIAGKSVGTKKKAPARKMAAKKKVAAAKKKVAAGKKAPARKRAAKQEVPAKKKVAAGKKGVAKKAIAGRAAGGKKKGVTAKNALPQKKLSKRQRDRFRKALLLLRDRLAGQISSLKNASLTRQDTTNLQEDGTDAFDRQVALNLVTSEHKAVRQIDEALRSLMEGSYGICEGCSCLIEIPRLEALPFVRMCVQCQSVRERGGGGVRPFGARRRRGP